MVPHREGLAGDGVAFRTLLSTALKVPFGWENPAAPRRNEFNGAVQGWVGTFNAGSIAAVFFFFFFFKLILEE